MYFKSPKQGLTLSNLVFYEFIHYHLTGISPPPSALGLSYSNITQAAHSGTRHLNAS